MKKMNLETAVRITRSNGATEKSISYMRNCIHKGESQKSFFKKILFWFYSVAPLLRVSNAFYLALAALMLLTTACTTVPFVSTELIPTTPRSAAELSRALWNSGTGTLMIRQSALFEFEGAKVPVTGAMKLDLSGRSIRLIGMNDMGVKLYDISVDATSSRSHFIIPELTRYPGFTEAVADSVRRIFLTPEPAPDDTLERTSTTYLLTKQKGDGRVVRFTLGGADTQLLEKVCRGSAESWRVRYYQYQRYQGRLFPGGMLLEDEQAGYRLTLWTESVDNVDE